MVPSKTNQSGVDTQATAASSSDADLTQAYRDLARGEQTAAALEANLSNIEIKLDDILNALEARVSQESNSDKVNNAVNTPPAEDDAGKGKQLK
ncbi:hypothetical protein QQZ08_002346 [Neonectria magnoliae]|uniref:EKC/KEOPS complex subunit GON7 n=1 Tax=Neonectria magnoliae TaxID=2732573 RepID=A0ABR1IC81_9HYPO